MVRDWADRWLGEAAIQYRQRAELDRTVSGSGTGSDAFSRRGGSSLAVRISLLGSSATAITVSTRRRFRNSGLAGDFVDTDRDFNERLCES